MRKVLYGLPNTRSFRVLWALEETGLDYDYQVVQLGKGEGQSDAFLALNPAGKLPVLKDGELILTESAAICSYLADCVPPKKLIPEIGSGERALYNQWSFFVLSELEQPLWTMGKHKFALPKEYRVREIMPTAEFEFRRAAKILDQGLGDREFLVGQAFTMADLLAAHTLMWARAFKVEHELPRLDSYLDRVTQREAWQRANRIDQEKAREIA